MPARIISHTYYNTFVTPRQVLKNPTQANFSNPQQLSQVPLKMAMNIETCRGALELAEVVASGKVELAPGLVRRSY